MTEQQENLDRVTERISGAVLTFCEECLERDKGLFYMEDLRSYIDRKCGLSVAPDSPGRILRLLRQEGKIDYFVLCRKDSLYQLLDWFE